MSETIRTFFAIALDESLRRHYAVVIDGLKKKPTSQSVHWVKPENLHISLKFLGETNPAICTPLCERIEKQIEAINPFSLTLTNPVFFPSKQKPRVIAVAAQSSEELGELYNIINKITAEFGFQNESRPFLPHLTLGRIRDPLILPFEDLKIETKNMMVNEVIFDKSQLMPDGPLYVNLKRLYLDRRIIKR